MKAGRLKELINDVPDDFSVEVVTGVKAEGDYYIRRDNPVTMVLLSENDRTYFLLKEDISGEDLESSNAIVLLKGNVEIRRDNKQ